jgi:hypothetical protein
MKKMEITAVLAAITALSGCAAASKTYGPDGRQAFSINCSGAFLTWGECFKKAGDLCGVLGYDTLLVNGQNPGSVVTANQTTGVFAAPVVDRVMVISCKGHSN